MSLIDQLRTRWQEWTGEEDTPFDGDTSAWLVSMISHAGLIVVLFFLVMPQPQAPIELTIEAKEEEPPELVELEEVFFDERELDQEVGANSVAATDAALAMAEVVAEVSVVPTELEVVENPTEEVEISLDIPTAPVQSDSLTVMGSRVGEGTTGAPGAVDRITYEILQSLEQRKTLVVWMFDSTLSLKEQRSAIGSRFSKIYGELGLLEERGNDAFTKHEDKPLLSAVVSYGQNVELLTEEPTTDVEHMQKLVEGITHDKTGQENTFTAVMMSAQKFSEYRIREGRNVMLIAVTDEVGSDEQAVDQAVMAVRRFQMPVYVVGVPAPFGRKEVPFRYVNDDPQYERTEYWIPVHQGPESFAPETVNLAFWGSSRDQEQYELIDSGFGPYALTRLCAESGGIYFSVHPNRGSAARAMNRSGRGATPENSTLLYKFWDPAVMRAYAPDYVSARGYQQLLASNKARLALHNSAKLSGADAIQNPMTTFVKRNEGSLGQLAIEAQKQAARLEPRLIAMHEALRYGEKDRDQLVRPRWQAGFDLAMGRVLAARVRTEGYNQMLAFVKSGKPFKEEGNNTWNLVHSNEVTTGSTHQNMAKDALMYLQRVVDEHPGTPWAYLAQKELDTPLGWEWQESFTPIPEERQGMGNGNGNPNPNDELNRIKRKPRAPRPNL